MKKMQRTKILVKTSFMDDSNSTILEIDSVRAVGIVKIRGGARSNGVGIICLPTLIDIGLTDLPKSEEGGGGTIPCPPPVPTVLIIT